MNEGFTDFRKLFIIFAQSTPTTKRTPSPGLRTTSTSQENFSSSHFLNLVYATYMQTPKIMANSIRQFVLNFLKMAYHTKKSVPKSSTKGIYHDIELIYHQINLLYFDNQINAQILWGRFGTYAARKRSIRLGSYCSRKKCILIHPSLDQACVPRICVERIIYHEMLHQKFPVSKHPSGRRCVHGRQFKLAEQEFRDAPLADTWFKDNLKRLLS